MTRRDYLFTAALFLLLVGVFYKTGPGNLELAIFAVLAALATISLFLIKRHYSNKGASLKYHFIQLCMAFLVITVFYLALKALTGFSLNYSMLTMLFVALLVSAFWEGMDLTTFEKGVMAATIMAIIGGITYDTIATAPSTALQFYNEMVRNVENYEDYRGLLREDFRDDFTVEIYEEARPYLDQSPLRYNQPAIIELRDGRMVILEVGLSHNEWNKPLRITKFEQLPEEVASYFRYYPLEIERLADFPQGEEDNDTIIEVRGAFVSEGSNHQKHDWYKQLISVFGDHRVWDELWQDLGTEFASGNPLRGSGTNSKGYLEVRLDESWQADERVLNEIYGRFQHKAAENGIEDLPMVFKWHKK